MPKLPQNFDSSLVVDSCPPTCSRSSDTPQTEANLYEWHHGFQYMEKSQFGEWVPADISRDMEQAKDMAMETLREIKAKYGLGDRHVMREKNREIEKLRTALKDATELLGEIMRDGVNHQDEAEKWLRAYGEISSENAWGMARELAAQDSESTTDLNG